MILRTVMLATLLFGVGVSRAAGARAAPTGPSLIGIDHIPTAVARLDRARDTYQRLGFSLKPGRPHGNGLRNAHVKFEDGSGIELIEPPVTPTDDLTRRFRRHLEKGDGPAYLAFHARNRSALVAALDSAGIAFDGSSLITLAGPRLRYIFFVQDNRSPTDRPEHFAHPNSAVAMTGVWLALDEASGASLRRLLLALGAAAGRDTVFGPEAIVADVFTLRNGRVVVLPAGRRLHHDRPIVGVEFRIRDAASARRILGAHRSSSPGSGRPQHVVAPAAAHGLWLTFDGP